MRFPLITALLLVSASLPAAVSFETEVKPIFEKHCVECHGPKKQKSDFRLDDREIQQKADQIDAEARKSSPSK